MKKKYKNSNAILRLSYLWRSAEDYYLETRSGWQKDRLYRFQKSLGLTLKEKQHLENLCTSMGV